MKYKTLEALFCLLLLVTMIPISAGMTPLENPLLEKSKGVQGIYKSLIPIPSPNNSSYRVIMFCVNHKQTLDWITAINQSGFQKAWRQHFLKATFVLMLPFSILLFGLNDFRAWYIMLFIQGIHKTEFQDFLKTYDTVNGSGMITYLWNAGTTDSPVSFHVQPDNALVNNSWILKNGVYIPNPEIWTMFFLWRINFP